MTAEGVGDLLRSFRSTAGLSREALAERAELSVEAIRALESGRRRHPRPATVSQLAEALHLSAPDRLRLERSSRRPPASARGPQQLPADIATFVGRERIVADIAANLTSPPRTPGGLVMVSIAGMGGIGKTALAVRIGRQLSSSFPAGQLYLNLRGHSDAAPMSPADALGRLLRTFGTPPGDIPDDVRTASARYRAILADRPMLILLDDAASASQVEPLLPGTGGSVVLITSRKRLSGLPGARHVGLDLLSEEESLGLLGSELDPGRIEAEPDGALEVVRLCGKLPLAVRIAGTYLADRPSLTLAQLVGDLSDENSRLGMLSADDIGVRSSIGLSLDALASGTRAVERASARALPLLSVLEGDEFSLRIGAAALGLPPDEAEAAIEHLVDVSLLETPEYQRYRLHDLVRAVGRELVDEDSRTVIRRRVLDQYLALLWRADELTDPGLLSPDWRDPAWSEAARDLQTFESAIDLLDVDRSGLLLTARAGAAGTPAERMVIVRMAPAMNSFVKSRKRWLEWRDLNQIAAGLVDEHRDPVAAAMIHFGLGLAHNELGSFAAGADHLRRVLALAPVVGNDQFEGHCVTHLAHALEQTDQLVEARAVAQRALELTRGTGAESWVHLVFGMIAGKEGGLDAQEVSFGASVELLRQSSERPLMMAMRRLVIGESYRHAGQHEQALTSLHESLRIYREVDQPNGAAEVLDILGAALVELSRYGEALTTQQEALTIAIETEQWDREASIRVQMGRAYAGLGDRDRARTEWRVAHGLHTAHGIDADHIQALLESSGDRSGSDQIHTVG